jgi:serine/threonine protein kinase
MEFLEGEPLHKIIEKKRFPLKEVLLLGIQVAETLDYAHQKGIVHRDVKPSNIIVQPSGQIKITDFGIAHIEDSTASLQTQAGEILGTPAYMSPEQVLSEPVDGRSDLFSLGIILYELSTGKRPFEGETLTAILHAITQANPPEPLKANPEIPQGLSRTILRCLRKTPAKRFENGKVLAETLRGYVNEAELTQMAIRPSFKNKKGNLFTLSILFACLIAVGVPSYLFLIRQSPPSPPPKVIAGPASVRIESAPPGAQVFVDGALKGATPLKMDIPEGRHEVRLSLVDYYDWEAEVQAEQKSELPLLIRMFPIREKKK